MLNFIIFIVVVIDIVRLIVNFKDQIHFFAIGNEKGFKFQEIIALWKLTKVADLEEPEQIFYSMPLMSQAIIRFLEQIRNEGTENLKKNQDFLSKLYDYRTRISLEHENNRGLDSSKYLDKRQKLRILLPGSGVFQSEILDNTTSLIIRVPSRKNLIPISGPDWVGKNISVYLWRKGDASYVFDSVVEESEIYMGASALKIKHSSELIRTQKRKSIRAACEIEAQLYFIDQSDVDYNIVETTPGFKSILEDISEDGALIRVGGKGVKDASIKIQFMIGETLVVMFGTIRAVEYNKVNNQSRLHFECFHIDNQMKNAVLSFVYKLLPEDKKEELDAITQTEADKDSEENGSSENPSDSQQQEEAVGEFVESNSETGVIEDLNESKTVEKTAEETSSEVDDSEKGGFDDHFEDKMNEFKEKMKAFR